MEKKTSLVESLLTENRFWTFWSSDWSKKLSVKWSGTLPWKEVLKAMKKQLGTDLKYERSVLIPNQPDVTFA